MIYKDKSQILQQLTQYNFSNKNNYFIKQPIMQKWQQSHKQKVHESKVQNAKSTFKRYSNSRQKPTQASRVRPIPYPVTKNQMPINKILEIFQLQHYAPLLNEYKFTQTLANLETISDQNEFINQISLQVELKDREKFESLLHTLVVMSKNMKANQKASKIKQPSKNSMYVPPPQPPSSTYSQSNYTPSSLPKTNKSHSRFRIKVRNNNLIHNTPKLQKKAIEVISVNRRLNNKSNLKQGQELSDKTRKRRKSINLPAKGRASDDLTFIHNFNLNSNSKQKQGKIQQVKKCSKIIQKLSQKLQKIQPSIMKNTSDDIQLDMNKIKQMYLSIDSATLTSNIINIDLQHLTQCFALQIVRIMVDCEVEELTKTNEQKIKSLLKQSFIIVKQEQRQSKTQLQSLHQSHETQINQNNNYKDQTYQQNFQKIDESIEHNKQLEQIQRNQISESCQSEFTQNNQRIVIKLKESVNNGMASSIWGNNYIASVINDFSCFDNFFLGEFYEKIPTQIDVKNFVDLVMMSGKMQKQIPILAFVYIDRLLKLVKGSKLTKKNWRNILLITLIQASKIWDDRSLQNHSFAKIIHPYTTLQLNRLQKYLLFFLDYHLNINQKQYSESYFTLRKHSGTPCHTVNLVKLDLKTIKKLQNIESCENKQQIEKKEFMRKCMNKSF